MVLSKRDDGLWRSLEIGVVREKFQEMKEKQVSRKFSFLLFLFFFTKYFQHDGERIPCILKLFVPNHILYHISMIYKMKTYYIRNEYYLHIWQTNLILYNVERYLESK